MNKNRCLGTCIRPQLPRFFLMIQKALCATEYNIKRPRELVKRKKLMDQQHIVIGMCMTEVSNSTIMSQLYAINCCYFSTSHVLASEG